MSHIDVYLSALVRERGSDLHLSPGVVPRIRIDGRMEAMSTPALDGSEIGLLLREIMSAVQVEQLESGGDAVEFAHEAPRLGRFRVSAFRERKGTAAVFRAIPRGVPTAEELNLPEVVRGLTARGGGLVLLTGASGEGKSTTLAAIVEMISRERQGHVVTIEDPIEFIHTGHRCVVTQRELGTHAGSYPDALADALRQDPDVIVVGEVRSAATLHLILQAAETGHLVLGTLHAVSAVKAVGRAVGMVGSDRREEVRFQLAEVLHAVVAQRLVPARGGGRVAAFEVLLNGRAVYQPILEGRASDMAAALESGSGGMLSLEYSLASLVLGGRIDRSVADAYANDVRALETRLAASGYDPFR